MAESCAKVHADDVDVVVPVACPECSVLVEDVDVETPRWPAQDRWGCGYRCHLHMGDTRKD